METPFLNREDRIRIFFFLTFAVICYQLFLLARPFAPALLLAVMLTLIFRPLYRRIRRWTASRTWAAALCTLLVLILAGVPLVTIGWFTLKEAAKLVPTVRGFLLELHSLQDGFRTDVPGLASSPLQSIQNFLEPFNIDFSRLVLSNVGDIGERITGWGRWITRNMFIGFLNVVVLIVTLFFTFRDGETFLNWTLSLIPMEHSHKQAVAQRAYDTFRAVLSGVFLTAAIQGMTAMFGFWVAGVRLPALLGIATMLTSLLGSSFLVTAPVAFSVMRYDKFWGFFLLFWGALVVGWLDNILRPILIGSKARMPFFLVFFSIIGGLKMYGPLGIILGPILVGIFLTFVKIYREAYNN